MQLTRAYQQDMEYPIISVHLLLLRIKNTTKFIISNFHETKWLELGAQ